MLRLILSLSTLVLALPAAAQERRASHCFAIADLDARKPAPGTRQKLRVLV